VKAGSTYLREELRGEAILTLGTALHAWRHGEIDAVLSAGPLECMPNKLAEAQFHHAAELEGLYSLTLNRNGEPPDPELLDGFAFEVHARHRAAAKDSLSPTERSQPEPLPALGEQPS
jgi:hypothetical protein